MILPPGLRPAKATQHNNLATVQKLPVQKIGPNERPLKLIGAIIIGTYILGCAFFSEDIVPNDKEDQDSVEKANDNADEESLKKP